MKREELENVNPDNPIVFTVRNGKTEYKLIATKGKTTLYGVFTNTGYPNDFVGSIEFTKTGLLYYYHHAFGKSIRGILKYTEISPVVVVELEKQLSA